jgi:hypothetical protein
MSRYVTVCHDALRWKCMHFKVASAWTLPTCFVARSVQEALNPRQTSVYLFINELTCFSHSLACFHPGFEPGRLWVMLYVASVTSLLANVFRQSGSLLWVRLCCLISVEQIWRTWRAVVGFRGFTNIVWVIIKHSHNKWFCLNVERKRSTNLLSSFPFCCISLSL